MIEKAVVKEIVEDYLKDSENYLVDLEVKPGNEIVVEIDNDQAVSIDDCIALNKYIESKLDRDLEDYELEVGSSGIGQAFKNPRQYRKNIGNEVELLAKSGIKYTGILKDAGEKEMILTIKKQVKPEGAKRKTVVEEDLTFTYSEIKHTKYLIRFK
ncbi:ribosome maturation factor RimP [Bacteroidia bacterium]|nr:ribosome maturation factor RimP [Bacteroidia bacterium]GHU83089.1 ribosome maturation factor RimP [Bacteroidia bacterium]